MAANGVETDIGGFFSPDGILAGTLPGYEERPQQSALAREVASAMARHRHLLVEAGTGVGKSLAYLLPAYIHSKLTKKPVVISTYTINLQEQLIGKDIPIMARALDEHVDAALAIGRRNYLCLRRLAAASKTQPDLFEDEKTGAQLEKIHDWAFSTEEGSLTDLDFSPARDLWEQINAGRHTCIGKNCATFEACFFRKARQRLRNSRLIVANHYLYFSDLGILDPALKAIPEHSCAIFDEAHTLEDVASECLGLNVSERLLSLLIRRLAGDDKRRGLVQRFADREFANRIKNLGANARDFFDGVREWARTSPSGSLRIREPLPVDTSFAVKMAAAATDITTNAREIEDENLRAEVSACALELDDNAQQLKTASTMALEGHVYWVERGNRDTALRSSPIRVSGLLQQLLFSQLPCVVLTGATLTVGKDDPFSFLRERIGIADAREIKLDSPFDYASQATIHIEKGIPPRQRDEHIPAIVHALKGYLKKSGGRALVLFTSYERMQSVAEKLAAYLDEQGWDVLVQGSGMSRAKMLEVFARDVDSILFGTSSFWQGVDVPGEALSSVVITHLPFSVPTDPVHQARVEELEQNGMSAFNLYSLPQAVLKLKQGIGRLIRSKTDNGTIVILDSRIATKRYGKIFIDSFPPCKIVVN